MQLSSVLKMVGLDISEQDLQTLQAIIPQLPAKINEVVTAINLTLINFHERLEALERQQLETNKLLHLIVEHLKGEQHGTGNRDQVLPNALPNAHSRNGKIIGTRNDSFEPGETPGNDDRTGSIKSEHTGTCRTNG